jgi:hypothetical protein
VVKLVGVKFYVNTYVFESRECNSGQNQAIKIVNKSCDNIVKFKYCGMTVTDLNSMKEEVKEDLTRGMRATSRSRISLSPSLLSRCMRWSLTMKEEHRLNASDNTRRVLRRISGLEMEQVIGD